MNKYYIRELDEYSKTDILNIIKKEEYFNQLRDYLIINIENDRYQFNYVGVILIGDIVIYCYPKYIPNENNIEDDFKQIINVIKKYKKYSKHLDYEKEYLNDDHFNLLSMMIFFVHDYFENGVYTNFLKTHEINGTDEINWDKTINEKFPIIKNKSPYYLEFYTRYKFNDLYDFFRLLHEHIITECSRRLDDVGLLELFDLTPAILSDTSLDDFGSINYITEKIDKELNIEFNSHKQDLLNAMKSYISLTNFFSNNDILTVYGTKTYYHVWEVMISEVFNNQLNKSLADLGFEEEDKLIDVIKKPKWNLREGFFETKTFVPDLITIYDNQFIILDAKYYKLKFENNSLTKQPGLSDVTKQYLYQLAFKEFIDKYEFDRVKNAFLLPTYCDEIINRGHVELNILSELELENIQVIMLPSRRINKLYLDNEKINISELMNFL